VALSEKLEKEDLPGVLEAVARKTVPNLQVAFKTRDCALAQIEPNGVGRVCRGLHAHRNTRYMPGIDLVLLGDILGL
jgi:hypothetical protein